MPAIPPTNIPEVLGYYRSEVVPLLAAALTIDDKFPLEVLNEIRASYTHLARAEALGADHSDFPSEIHAAWRHLRRSCLDCLKVCISVTAIRSEGSVAALADTLQLPDDVYKVMSSLRKRRLAIAAHEGQEPPHEVIEDLKELFNQYDEFYESLDDQYAGATAEERRISVKSRRAKRAWCNRGEGLVIGIAASAIVTWVALALF